MPDAYDSLLDSIGDPNRSALAIPRVKSFLDKISRSEGADYNTLVGGRRINDLSRHPNVVGLTTSAGPSTAFGRYQITGTTNRSKLAKYSHLDYSPENQDLRAVELLRQTKALDALEQGDEQTAIKRAGKEWASLPGSPLPGRKNHKAFAPADPYDSLLDEVSGAQSNAPEVPPIVSSRFGTNAPVQRGPVRGPKPKGAFAGVTGGVEPQTPVSIGELRRAEDWPGRESAVPRGVDLRVMKGEQPIDRLAYQREGDIQSRMPQESYRDRVAREKIETDWRVKNQPEIERQTQLYKQDIQRAKRDKGDDPSQWLAEFGTKAAAGLTEFGAGVTGADTLRIKAEAARRAAEEEGATRGAVSKFVQDVGAGFISSVPELAAMSLGAPPIATFAAGSGIRARGTGQDIPTAVAHGALTGAAFEVPGIGRGLTKILTRAGGVGAGTTAVDLAAGQPFSEALKSGAVNAAMVSVPSLIERRGNAKAAEVAGEPVRRNTENQVERRSQDVAGRQSAPEQGLSRQRFQHVDFGEVQVVSDQSGAGRTRLKVAEVASPENVHYVKKSDMQGRGNARMIPVKSPTVEAAPVLQVEAAKSVASLPEKSVEPSVREGEKPKITDRIDRLQDVEKSYWDGNADKLTVYYDERVSQKEVHSRVAKALQDARLGDSVKNITFLSTEKGTFAPSPQGEVVKQNQSVPELKILTRGGQENAAMNRAADTSKLSLSEGAGDATSPAPIIRRSKTRGKSTLVTGERSDITLSQFVRKRGGIAPGTMFRGELERISPKETGTTGLVNKNARGGGGAKMTADYMMEAANEAGFGPYENVGDFLYDVGRDATGDKIQALVGDEINFDKEYRKHAERDIADEKDRRAAQQSAERLVGLIEGGRGGQLFDKITANNATEAEHQELRTLARKNFVRSAELEGLINEAKTEGVSTSFESIAETPSAPRGSRAEQLGFVQEGLEQQSVPPIKVLDQRERLIREEEQRQRAANPKKAAAQDTLASIRERGMTVDDYARQGSLTDEVPSAEKLETMRGLERGKRGQTGAVDVDLLTLGVRPFAKDVASRGREVVSGTREIANGIQSLLAPPSRSEQAQQTSRIVRANAAEMARAHDIADKSLEGARKFFSKQQPEANYEFIDRMERGQSQPDDKTQVFADTFRRMMDERRDQIRALGTGKLENFIEDYFPHIWKDPKKAKDVFAGVASKRPFEGSKSFLKQRTLPFTADGLKLGLESVSANPVDLAVLKLREMDKYLMAHQVMGEMKEQGNLKFFKVSERLPDGWKQIDDRVATVFSRSEKGELILRGRYAAPEPAAKIINNYLSPGLNATMFRVPFKAWRATSNLLNQFQLGFSAFHAGFTTVDAIVSRAAAGLEDLTRGRPLRAATTIAGTPISPITNLIQGSKMLKEWYKPGSQGAEIGALVSAMQEGGGRARMDQFYSNSTTQKFMDTLRQGNLIGATLRAPGAAIELLSKPVMEQLVPRQKMGIFADLAKREIERLGPDATQAQTRHAMAKAWDSVDNRMGQLVYDNLFWDKTLKDLSMASVRSVGWNIGTLREVGGGLTDYAGLPKRVIQKVRGKNPDPLFTHRMAYTTALPLVVGTMGAMTQYLLTGKGPDSLKDYFFPKTGIEDENGNPERISFPSYMKDVFHAWEEPGKVVTNKLHPLVGLISEMLRNEDYYGTKIRNEDDPFVQQLKDTALHVGESALPFSVRGYQKETERGGSLKKRVLPFVGITPAPSYINKSPAEKLISRKVEEAMPRGSRTREEAERSRLRHQLQSKARNDQDITSDVDVAIKQGKLKPDDAHDILRDAKQSPLQLRYKRLKLTDALEVWDVMTKEERADVKDILTKKAKSVEDMPETEQDAVKKKMEAIGLRPGIVPREPKQPREPRKPRQPRGLGYVFQ